VATERERRNGRELEQRIWDVAARAEQIDHAVFWRECLIEFSWNGSG
jgi:hypothetical protein